jgi:ABC-2 type transport system permease protein
MTAFTTTGAGPTTVTGPATVAASRHEAIGARIGGSFLGFGPLLGKELTEWVRTRRAIALAAISLANGVFTSLIPRVVEASGGASRGVPLSLDPTTNVLTFGAGQAVPMILVLATTGLMSGERDRGTLAWTMSKPVSRPALLLAKWSAAMLACAVLGLIVPLVAQAAAAAYAYGAAPDASVIIPFAALYLAVPAFYVALTLAVGTVVRSTSGVAGIALLVALVPPLIATILPDVAPFLPTSISTWALVTAGGHSASVATAMIWLAAMAALCGIAFIALDRQDL